VDSEPLETDNERTGVEEMLKTSVAAALAAAVALGAFAAPAAQAHGKFFKHHKFFFKPYYHNHYYKPVCGKWVWSRRYDRWVCTWWY